MEAPAPSPLCKVARLDPGTAAGEAEVDGEQDKECVRFMVYHTNTAQRSIRTQTSADLSGYIYMMQWLMVWRS